MLDLKSVDMRFIYLMELRGKDICVGDKKCKRVKIYVGRPLADTPKTYKRIGGFVAKELSNAYNSGCVSMYISIDTEWVGRIFKHFPEKAWNNTIINMNICVEYGTGDIWYSRVRTFEGGCCSEYILTSRKPRKNNRRELVNNPEDQLLGFDTVRETVFGMKKELSIDESVNVKFDYEII